MRVPSPMSRPYRPGRRGRWSRPVTIALAALLAGLALIAPASAGQPAEPGHAPGELTRADVAAWLDGMVPSALSEGDIAGAVVSVVRDGKVLYQRGFGHADVAAKRPVDPERTLFRIGSVAKVFTATAVMQLVEAGRLDLDTDVRRYLDFPLETRFPQPITLRHLLTHSAGFQETIRDLFVPTAAELPSLRDYLVRAMPEQIFTPGKVPAYSNYGNSLAGYIVARASGMSFDDYLDEKVLGPLGMTETSSRQPLPDELAGQLSRAYQRGSGPPVPFEFVSAAPAGSMSATAADMARFMIAHLRQGELDGHRLFRPDTAERMHSAAVDVFPTVNEMAVGFWQQDRNGHRAIGHGGDTTAFHSEMRLFPDDRTGIFVSLNSTGAGGAANSLRTALLDGFADRYFPAASAGTPPATRTTAEHAALAAGSYEGSRRWDHGFFSVLNLMQPSVQDNGDGTITVSAAAGPDGQPKVFREVEPFVWQEVGGRQRIAMTTSGGQVTSIMLEPPFWLTPAPGWRDASWNLPLLIGSIAVLLLTVLAWPVIALVRRHYRAERPAAGALRRSHLLVRLAAILSLLVLAGWVLLMLTNINTSAMPSSAEVMARVLQVLGLIGLLGVLAAVWQVIALWRTGGRWLTKTWSVLIVLAFAGIGWFSFAFDLFALDLDY